jgi:hypothetical protein
MSKTQADIARHTIYKRRYGTDIASEDAGTHDIAATETGTHGNAATKPGTSDAGTQKVDLFMNAWMMIKVSATSGVPIFGRRLKKKEMASYMHTLCISDFPCDDDEALAIREQEWASFARTLISVCTNSRGYCSTLFGMVPIKDETVLKKIAEEIVLVTKTYPSAFGLYDDMKPFSDAVIKTYCEVIENGDIYIADALR